MRINNYSILSKATAIAALFLFGASAVQAQVPASQACPPNGYPSTNCASANNGYIRDFSTTNGINNITNNGTGCGATATGYSDFTGTAMKVTQNAGASVTARIVWVGNSGNNYTSAFVRIYVDWDRDGLFTTPGEFIQLSGGSGAHVANTGSALSNYDIPVPMWAKQGLTRMRVCASGSGLGNPNPATGSCSQGGAGECEDYTFEVINPCLPPNTISVSNLDFESGDFEWTEKQNADFYEYVITPADTIPHDTVIGFTFTTDNRVEVDTFQCDQKYYILVRAICDTVGKGRAINWDKSAWKRDSFYTEPCCYDPQLKYDQLTHNSARLSWDPIATAIGYEYAVTTLTTPPQQGTYTINTSVVLQGLSSKQTYFVFVRTRCVPTPLSDWSNVSFKTLKGLSVDQLNGEDFYIQAYPSPVRDILTVDVTGQRDGNANITVTDLNGRVVYNAPVTSERVQIDATNFTSGIYIVKYTDDTHNKIMRVIK